MFTISNYNYDCTKKCKCRDHGRIITSAITKKSISDDKLAAFIAKTCRNFAEIVDFEGRSALHLASSVGRYAIAEWLLNHGALINNKDLESGHSALHRAIFYGCIDCAVLLLRYGANIEAIDDDCRNPLQIICKYNQLDFGKNISQNNELLAWGANKNYNLGVANEETSNMPQFVDIFRKQNIRIKSLAISTYHSIFMDKKGELYTVGHGNGGRLGTGNENSLTTPKRIKLSFKNPDEYAVCVSCSKNHTLVLTNTTSVYACGLNSDKQLGIKPPPEKLTSFKEVVALSSFRVENLVGIIAKDYHSIAYYSSDVYVWGANRGQFGIKSDTPYIILPNLLPLPEKKIQLVESSLSAIAIYTECKHIFLFYNYKMKSFKTPNLDPLVRISLSENAIEKSSKQGGEKGIKLLVLTATSCIHIWYEENQQYIGCLYSIPQHLHIDKIILGSDKLLILSEGDLYMGQTSKISVHGSMHISEYQDTFKKDLVNSKYRVRIDLKRIPNVDRVVNVFCDDDFESFAVLQENSRKYFLLPQLMAEEYTFKNLLNEVSELDIIHDIIFHVDNETFPAHKFIVFSRSKGLLKVVNQYEDKNIYLNYNGLTGKMFELVLKYIYTNYFISEEDLDDILQSMGPSIQADRSDVNNIFKNFVIKFELHDLTNYLKSFNEQLNGYAVKHKCRFPRLNRTMLPELYDVTIKCADNQEIYAHKCVLVARLEYFNLMFNSSWAETRNINLTTIPVAYMGPIIDFLYTSDVENFRKQKYSENFLYNMIVICDQFFINRLRRVCEILVLERITVRKCGEMLEFACSYNCELLERSCLEFICQNLARILEQRSLEKCQPEILSRINIFYRNIFKNELDFRVITPKSDSISDECLIDFVSDFNIELDYKMLENGEIKQKTTSKTKMNKSAQSKRNYEKEAIISMRDLSLDRNLQTPIASTSRNNIELEIRKVCDKIHSNSEKWMTVHDKKDPKKNVYLAAIKTNQIIKEEKRPDENFININQTIKNSNKVQGKVESSNSKDELHTSTRSSISLGEFTLIKNEKLSQKQRKRLSSESKPEMVSTVSKPIQIPQNNSWQTVESTPSVWQSPLSNDQSFAEIMKSPDSSYKSIHGTSPEKSKTPKSPDTLKSPPSKTSSSSPNIPTTITNRGESSNFSKILADERKQKEYFEKLKSKSLILTQIEETAIDELKAFYNVDNVFDEFITIDRKCIQATMNFAIWQHH